MSEIALLRNFEYSASLPAAPGAVFDFLDDFTHLGAHMTRANRMMAGSRMSYRFDASHGREVGAWIRLTGSFLGIPIEIEERVIDRDPPHSKAWRTVGLPRMLVMGAYRMGYSIRPLPGGSQLNAFIDYVNPQRGIGRALGALFGGAYARWCVRSMLTSAIEHFGTLREAPADGTGSPPRNAGAPGPLSHPG